MLNYNELKYLATKMATNPKTNPNLPIFRDFDGTKPIDATPPSPPEPGFMDKLKAFGTDYGGAMGYGAGAGALAGIPLALLANALIGGEENQSIRGYLKSALLGALLGGGLGAAGGAGLRGYLKEEPGVRDALGKALGKSQEKARDTDYIAPEILQYVERLKNPIAPKPKPSAKDMELARQGRKGIPGVTLDYFGYNEPFRPDTLTSDLYGGLRDAFTGK